MWSPTKQCAWSTYFLNLYQLYINFKVSFHLFTNDTVSFHLFKNVNVALNNISNWLKANKLTLNVKKSHLFIFNINNNKMQIKLFIDKEELKQKHTAKYLGIFFDKNLTWSKHIE